MAAKTLHSVSGGPLGAPYRLSLKVQLVPCMLLLLLLFCCNPLEAKAATAATAASTSASVAAATAAAAAALLLLPSRAESKKVFGIARGPMFEAVGDFCFSVPPGSSGALVAETVRCTYTANL